MRKTLTAALLVCLVGIFAVAGCDTGPSEVRIGVLAELTGSIPAVGASCQNATKLAAIEINEAGGITIAGRKHNVELEIRDCDSNPRHAADLAVEMMEKDGVVAIVGPNATANALTASEAAERAGLVLVTPWSTSPNTTITKSGKPKKFVYRVCVTASYEGEQLAKFATQRLGAKSAALFFDNTAEVLNIQSQEFRRSFTADGGRVVANETFRPTEKDFSAQLGRIRDAAADILFVNAYYSDVPGILRQAKSMGIASQVIGSDAWSSPNVIAASGDAIEGAYVFNMYSPEMPGAVTQGFVKAYEARYKSEPDDVAALAYDAVMLVKKGLEKSDAASREALGKSMLEVRELRGTSGDMRFTAASRNPIRGGVMLKVTGGRFTLFEQL